MVKAHYGGLNALVASRGRLLAALLVVTLVLCHGVFGAIHLVSQCEVCDPAQMSGMTHHSAAQQVAGYVGGDDVGDEHAGGIGGTAYAAVVIAALGVTILALLFIYRERRLEVFVSLPSWRPIPFLSHHPRGPMLSSLQVFRL